MVVLEMFRFEGTVSPGAGGVGSSAASPQA